MSRKNNTKVPIVGELSRHIENGSKTGIINCLTTVKNDSKVFELFIADKGLNIVIKLLKYQSSKVLDIALSILANAFLRGSVREQVNESSIANNVVWIIKNLSSGLTLHCRACRLIGNMSDSKRHTKALCEAGVVKALKGIINDSKTNTPTLLMSIRALRNIWNINEESHTEILNLNLVKSITDIFITSKLKQSDSSSIKYKDTIETCLKALRSFADTSDPRSGEQMRGKDLRGYQYIVDLCKINSRIAFQLLYKLCKVPNHRPALGTVGVVECLVDFLKIKRTNSTTSSFKREVIASFCLLSREAVNRLKIREEGGLELMVNLLADIDNEVYHPALLHALTLFVYDENNILIMIKNGIVGVLTDRLRRMAIDLQLETSSSADNTSESSSTSRKRARSPARRFEGKEIKYNRTNSGRFSFDFPTQWSPSSVCSSTSSPTSSPPLPNYDSENPTDEDNYSPVCSDTEDWIDEDSTAIEDDSLNSFASAAKDEITDADVDLDPDEDPDDLEMETPEVNFSHTWTLSLLAKLALQSDPIEGLADSTTIQALTSYMELSKNLRARISILNRILKNHVYFLPLLLQGFVFEAQLLDNSQDYLQILSNVAEQGGAFGELAATLLRGQEADKHIIAVSVPFVLKSREKLRLLLDTYGGLDMIFKLLEDRKHLLSDNAVLSVCQLARTLGIMPETFDKPFSIDKDSEDTESMKIDDDKEQQVVIKSNVTFELDDGGTVDACRHLLCLKSQVFSAMLDGNFYESGKKRVRLQNVSKGGFIVLYLAASGQLLSNDDDNDDGKVKIESLLDAVLLADRFLMVNELDKLTETSLMRIGHSNLNRAWNWARDNDCSELQTYCVTNFLTNKFSREHRLTAFNNFLSDKNFIEFLEEVKKIVTSQLLDRQ